MFRFWGYDIGAAWSAGQVVWSGKNPYLENSVFAYPPYYLPFCSAISLFSYRQAAILITGVNFLLTFYMAFITHRYLVDVCRIKFGRSSDFRYITVLSLVALNPFTLSALFQGQTSIFVFSSFLTAWYFLKIPTPRPLLAGLFLGLAAIKPHLVVLPCIWLALQKSWKALFLACFVVIALMLPAFIQYGPIETMKTWYTCLENYRLNSPLDRIGSPRIVGLSNMFFFLGLPTYNMLPLSMLAVLSLWCVRCRFNKENHLSILMIFTSLFVFMQNYDQLVLIPAFIPLACDFLYKKEWDFFKSLRCC